MTPPRIPLLVAALAIATGGLVSTASQPSEAATAAGPTISSEATPLRQTEIIDLGNGVTMEFVLISAGRFTMGSNDHDPDESPAHPVRISQPYYLGRFEVTQAQWTQVMGSNPSHFKDPQRPVENVSWIECHQFLAAFRQKVGRSFALPTEAEWEYACRAGSTTEFSFGNDESELRNHAWFSGNAELSTHPVGQKRPNAWGLHDMHGNVFEWCEDSFADGYPAGESVDPLNRGTGQRRILRGGAWLYVTDNLRSSDRAFSPPDYRSDEYGFRCVMRLPRPGSPDDNVTTPKQPAGETNPPPMTADARANILLSEAAKAVEDGNRYHAENLLNQAAQLQQDDPRLTVLRTRASALPVPKDTLVVDLGGGVSMEFVLIKPGTFTMGSDESALTNERPAHAVTITKPFYLGKYEVTQEQWLALMSRNLSTFKAGNEPGGAAKLPVENVSWDLCQSFVAKLNQRAEGHRFRLPTEAEWEYACRAGCTAGPRAPDPAAVGELAWFGENAGGRTHAIGTRKPNAWGLHDMYGNVWEWCEDWIGEYPTGPVSDPSGPASWQSTGGKVLRGGAWNNIRAHVNSTFRHDANPDMVMRYYGFRCAASVAEANGRAPASTP